MGKYIKKTGTIEKKCETCSGVFKVSANKAWELNKKYCTDVCNPKRKRPTAERTCDMCGKKFVTARLTGPTQAKRCSQKCRRKWNLERGVSEEQRERNRKVHWAKNNYVIPEPDELVFYGYKNPLRRLDPKTEGYGYDGVVLYSRDALKIQCHVCGRLFRNVGSHSKSAHKLSASQYKKKFNLMQKTALVGETTRVKLIKAHDGLQHKTFSHKGKTHKQVVAHMTAMSAKSDKSGNGGWSLEKRNETGSCPQQLISKIKELARKLKRRPKAKEYMKAYGSIASIITVYGTWNEAIRMSKFMTFNDEKAFRTSREFLLESMRSFYKVHGRTPRTSDMRRGLLPYHQAYCTEFGTLNKARQEAGIPVLIQISKYRYDEVDLTKEKIK